MGSMMEQVRRRNWRRAEMTVEVRLLYVSALLFIVAQSVVTEHPWDQGFRIAALLALIGAMFSRRAGGRKERFQTKRDTSR
jgi:uncharacterized protein involved in response to NO